MRFAVLGSGSSGNSYLIRSGETRVLVDLGLSAREIGKRLALLGEEASRIDAVVISHEHSDHIRGVPVFCKSTQTPLYMSSKVRDGMDLGTHSDRVRFADSIEPGTPFEIGPITFTPFTVPHDAVDPLAFTFEADGVKVGLVTDLGYITDLVAEHLRGCHALIIESNHDLDMLKECAYPWPVKQRVMSRHGHISNDELGRFLQDDFDGAAQFLVLAHLSQNANHPELARLSAVQALDARGSDFYPGVEQRIKLARHDVPSEWFDL